MQLAYISVFGIVAGMLFGYLSCRRGQRDELNRQKNEYKKEGTEEGTLTADIGRKGGTSMPTEEQHQDVLRRIKCVEDRLTKLEDRVNTQEVVDMEVRGEIVALHKEFTNLKIDVISTLKDHTDRTWGLMNKMGKVIIILIIIITIFAGIRLGPEILKLFGG